MYLTALRSESESDVMKTSEEEVTLITFPLPTVGEEKTGNTSV